MLSPRSIRPLVALCSNLVLCVGVFKCSWPERASDCAPQVDSTAVWTLLRQGFGESFTSGPGLGLCSKIRESQAEFHHWAVAVCALLLNEPTGQALWSSGPSSCAPQLDVHGVVLCSWTGSLSRFPGWMAPGAVLSKQVGLVGWAHP